jgi:hypothetical protein
MLKYRLRLFIEAGIHPTHGKATMLFKIIIIHEFTYLQVEVTSFDETQEANWTATVNFLSLFQESNNISKLLGAHESITYNIKKQTEIAPAEIITQYYPTSLAKRLKSPIAWEDALSLLCDVANGIQMFHKINWSYAISLETISVYTKQPGGIETAVLTSVKTARPAIAIQGYAFTFPDTVFVLPFIPPEVDTSTAGDVYNLGQLILRMGLAVYRRTSRDVIDAWKKRKGLAQLPAHFSDVLKEAIAACLYEDPSKRPTITCIVHLIIRNISLNHTRYAQAVAA